MTLKEKFENVMHNWINEDYDRKHVASELEIDADEFAIGFAEWLNFNFKLDFSDKAFEELLVVYKKEKGL